MPYGEQTTVRCGQCGHGGRASTDFLALLPRRCDPGSQAVPTVLRPVAPGGS
jgi:hypothetical protein